MSYLCNIFHIKDQSKRKLNLRHPLKSKKVPDFKVDNKFDKNLFIPILFKNWFLQLLFITLLKNSLNVQQILTKFGLMCDYCKKLSM